MRARPPAPAAAPSGSGFRFAPATGRLILDGDPESAPAAAPVAPAAPTAEAWAAPEPPAPPAPAPSGRGPTLPTVPPPGSATDPVIEAPTPPPLPKERPKV